MGIALIGAFLIAAPAAMADYSLFMDWRGYENPPRIGPPWDGEIGSWCSCCEWEYGVATLVELTKGGGDTVTNGTVSWTISNSAWTVTPNYQDNPNRYWISFDGTASYSDSYNYFAIGIALTGSLGWNTLPFLPSGIMANVSLQLDSYWDDLWVRLGSLEQVYSWLDFQRQSYLNGVETDSTVINAAHDSMVTFLFSDSLSDALIADYYGGWINGFGIEIAPNARDMSFAIVAVVSLAPAYSRTGDAGDCGTGSRRPRDCEKAEDVEMR